MNPGPSTRPPLASRTRLQLPVVALALFLSGFCGIVSELSLFNLAETLLGGTNENLTYTMGFMMFAMGAGSALSAHRLMASAGVGAFAAAEVALSLLAMGCVPAIYALAGLWPALAPWLIWSVSPMLGLLIGLEIPLVLRINERLGLGLRPNAALVLAPDYFGALAAFVAFAFWLLPTLGLARAAWLGGVLNLGVAGLMVTVFAPQLVRPRWVVAGFVAASAVAVALGVRMEPLMARAEQLHYRDGVVLSEETPYQQIVITDHSVPGNPNWRPPDTRSDTLLGSLLGSASGSVVAEAGPLQLRRFVAPHPSWCREDVRLFIHGGLQFSTCDEHRYHEMLVHPAAVLAGLAGTATSQGTAQPRVLVLGGGDGLAVRELLKYPRVQIDLVELDAEIVALFRDDPRFSSLNGGALSDPRVRIHEGDALRFLREQAAGYRLIVMDFPDPHRTATARLYSREMYRFARRALARGGVLVTQSFSPLFNQPAFLVVRKTLVAAGLAVVSLQVPMLTFEHWGFHVASADMTAPEMTARLEEFATPAPTRFLNRAAVQAAQRWDKEAFAGLAALPVNDQFSLPLLLIYTRGSGGRTDANSVTDSDSTGSPDGGRR